MITLVVLIFPAADFGSYAWKKKTTPITIINALVMS